MESGLRNHQPDLAQRFWHHSRPQGPTRTTGTSELKSASARTCARRTRHCGRRPLETWRHCSGFFGLKWCEALSLGPAKVPNPLRNNLWSHVSFWALFWVRCLLWTSFVESGLRNRQPDMAQRFWHHSRPQGTTRTAETSELKSASAQSMRVGAGTVTEDSRGHGGTARAVLA